MLREPIAEDRRPTSTTLNQTRSQVISPPHQVRQPGDIRRDPPRDADAKLAPFPEAETALPEKPTILHRDGVRIERIDRIGLELGIQWQSQYHVEDNDPLSAVAELNNVQTMADEVWRRDWDRSIPRDFM